MTKIYTNKRSEEIMKKKRREKSQEKPKIIITPEIICGSCNKFSGWTNDDLRFVSGIGDIKCTSCGEPCIKTFCAKKNIKNSENE